MDFNMKLYVVGTGPGTVEEMTHKARLIIEECDVVAGYEFYIDLIRSLLQGKKIISTGMTGEVERCTAAIKEALEGKKVCVISGGDAGVYGMAGLVLELAVKHPQLEIEIVPGVTAACSAAAVLGAPLTHDFSVISLSDRLTAWDIITKRLHAAAQADFIISLYNPASKARKNHLKKACEIIMQHRSPQTPCGIVRNIGRDGESSMILRLDELVYFDADMFTTIVIGNSETYVANNKLITPRGYDTNNSFPTSQYSHDCDKMNPQESVPHCHITNPQEPVPHQRFPFFIPLENKKVLIVGGGRIAARRAKVLLDFGASVTVVSPEICADMIEITDRIVWEKRSYSGIDQNFTLVIAVTDDRQVNKQIGENAKALGIYVSVADRKEESTFWFPAIARGSGIIAGLISEAGNHKAVKKAASDVRKVLNDDLGESE